MIRLTLTKAQVQDFKLCVEQQALPLLQKGRKAALMNSIASEWYKRNLAALTFPKQKQNLSFKPYEAIVMADLKASIGTLRQVVIYELNTEVNKRYEL